MNRALSLGGFLVAVIAVIIGVIVITSEPNPSSSTSLNDSSADLSNIPQALQDNFSINFANSTVNFDEVVQGVRSNNPKDVIPALDDPEFIPVNETPVEDDVQGLLVEIGDIARFYPYSILNWHEIINDTIDDSKIAVTFCPLCGSGIVFNRQVGDEVLEFGVSGFLRESNMIMYDRSGSESLWQQATGLGIAGDKTGTQLEFINSKLLTLAEVKNQTPNATVLSTDTGFSRDYEANPYGSYDEDEAFIFQPSTVDTSYPIKEVFQIVNDGDVSLAIRRNADANTSFTKDIKGTTYNINFDEDKNITVTRGETTLPGYFEMWFSWAVQHQNEEFAEVFDSQAL